MMYDHWGMGCGGGIGMLVFTVLLILGIVFLVRYLSARGGSSATREDTPLDILKKRYARGEISQEEYARMRKELSE